MTYTAYPSVTITHNGVDVTTKVISYSRGKDLCNFTGECAVVFDIDCGISFSIWDRILIRDVSATGTDGYYFVNTISKDQKHITVSCQDGSKRLQDYFIDTPYTSYLGQTTKTLLEYFLDLAGVTYSFDASVGLGELVQPYTSYGMTSAMTTVASLLQQSSWYAYFDGNNVMQIFELTQDETNSAGTINGNEILAMKIVTSDKMFRNRVVVWGGGDPDTGDYIYADVDLTSEHQIDAKDIRTVVVQNGNIDSSADAVEIATDVLNVLGKINDEVNIECTFRSEDTDLRGVDLAKVFTINSTKLQYTGIITEIEVEYGIGGLIIKLNLGRKCPKIFGYYNYPATIKVVGDILRNRYETPVDFNYLTVVSGSVVIHDGPGLYPGTIGIIGDEENYYIAAGLHNFRTNITNTYYSFPSDEVIADLQHSYYLESAVVDDLPEKWYLVTEHLYPSRTIYYFPLSINSLIPTNILGKYFLPDEIRIYAKMVDKTVYIIVAVEVKEIYDSLGNIDVGKGGFLIGIYNTVWQRIQWHWADYAETTDPYVIDNGYGWISECVPEESMFGEVGNKVIIPFGYETPQTVTGTFPDSIVATKRCGLIFVDPKYNRVNTEIITYTSDDENLNIGGHHFGSIAVQHTPMTVFASIADHYYHVDQSKSYQITVSGYTPNSDEITELAGKNGVEFAANDNMVYAVDFTGATTEDEVDCPVYIVDTPTHSATLDGSIPARLYRSLCRNLDDKDDNFFYYAGFDYTLPYQDRIGKVYKVLWNDTTPTRLEIANSAANQRMRGLFLYRNSLRSAYEGSVIYVRGDVYNPIR